MAIQSKELMQNNWVLDGDTPVRVMEILVDSVNTMQCEGAPIGELEPIPLTPEILECCGFEKSTFDNSWFNDSFGFIEKTNDGIIIPDDMGENSIAYTIDYLHQLQNIFYFTTGKELEINQEALTKILSNGK